MQSHHLRILFVIAILSLVFLGASVAFLADMHSIDRVMLFGLPAPRGLALIENHESVRDLTSLGSPPVVLLFTAIAVCYLVAARRIVHALVFGSAMASGLVLAAALKLAFAYVRPHSHTFVDGAMAMASTSFPSGHAMLAALFYPMLAALAVRTMKSPTGGLMLAGGIGMALLAGISRLFMGVHWPTDVLAGWSFGFIWTCVGWIAFPRACRLFAASLPVSWLAGREARGEFDL